MKKFRLLRADEIEVRIAQAKEKGVSLLLYKTARTDANLLDETVGTENWENDFKVVDGVLYGGIGIYFEDKDRWVWKWDAGTESNTEAEKGRASDAFKRAGFKWAIGRELYTTPFIWIPSDKCKIVDGKKCFDKFSVTEIGYNDANEINRLVINNDTLKTTAFTMGKAITKKAETKKATQTVIEYIATEASEEELKMILDAYHIDLLEQLTPEQADKCVRAINKRKAESGNVA